MTALFPGHRAGASLKPFRKTRGFNFRSLFPGHRAGASLKLAIQLGPVIVRVALPRPPSRGLIEAVRHRLLLGGLRRSSPATEPGPH